jgi:hypothetical protein
MKVLKGTVVTLGAVAAALVFTAGPAMAHCDDDKGYGNGNGSNSSYDWDDDNDFWDNDDDYDGVSQHSHDNNGIGNGTQIYSPISTSLNVCGNAVAILGSANAGAVCVND